MKLLRVFVSVTILIIGILTIAPNLPADLAMLVRRGHETIIQSLARLDQAVTMGLEAQSSTFEIEH